MGVLGGRGILDLGAGVGLCLLGLGAGLGAGVGNYDDMNKISRFCLDIFS